MDIKHLMLVETDINNGFYQEWKKNGISVAVIFKRVSKLARGFRRLWMKYNLPFSHLWYANWKNDVKKANVIIFNVSYLTLTLPRYINSINPSAKVVAWYWNTVLPSTSPYKIKGKCKIWSFDPDDCKKYNLNFNHQYYFKSFVIPPQKNEWDIYFCGKEMDRGNDIMKIYEFCESSRIKTKFQVVNPESDKIPANLVTDYVKYDEIRQNIVKSNAILEVVRDGQSGPTLRLMEAVFFQKKLITNNPKVKEEEFYNDNNIFVYSEQPLSELQDFLNSEFIPYRSKIIDKYDVHQWIDNFSGDDES